MIEWFEKAIDFSNILNISITASWLILVVIGLRLVLKKAPKWINVALWGIVALRLLMPFSIESSLSLVPSVETVSDQLLQAEPEFSHGEAQLDIITNPNYGSFVTMDLDDSMDSFQWNMVKMSLVWYAGIAAMSIYTLISFNILRRKLRTAVILRDNLFQCETVSSPFVLGILKPRIYLPYGMDNQNLSYVIAHEQAHIRRKDHWWKPLGFLLLTIHWFNPLMWIAYILLCRDIELACDEKVIAELGNEQRADYTQALVACAVNRRMIAACPLAFGEVGVKDRVKSVMNYKKPTFWIIMTALVVCVVVAVCFLTDPNPSREFSMSGNNVSNLDPEAIVDRILDIENIDNSGVYTNSMNFSLQVDSDFNWADSQAVSYFFMKSKTTYKGQLRIFPNEEKYFLTEPTEGQEQQSIFLLRHYLEAIKYLPQEAIRQMAPADQYIIQHREEGRPSDYERVITYTPDGAKEIEGWNIHLQIQPLHEDGEAYSGTGEEVIDVFYSSGNGRTSNPAVKWFDYTEDPSEMSYEQELKIQLDEFPGITFKYTPYDIIATTSWEDSNSAGKSYLISGLPIWNAYFCDLTGDGLPEICSQVSFGSGMIDNRVIIHDYANGASYSLIDRGFYDYYLRMNEEDGSLYVDKKIYNSDKLVSSGRLVFKNGCIQVEGVNGTSAELFPNIDTIVISRESSNAEQSAVTITDIEAISNILSIYESIQIEDYGRPLSEERLVLAFYSGNEYKEKWIISYYESDDEIVTCGDAFGRGNRRVTSEFDYNGLLDLFENASIKMIPTNTDLLGCPSGALLVPIDGNVYRYELSEDNPEGLSVDELLYTFTEETHIEGIVWEVYSLKEYPDKNAVLMLSGTNSAWLCKYSPPARCSEYALNQAMAAGYVVMEDGIGTSGQDIWKEFYERTQQGKPASVTVAHYYTLDPETCDSAYYETYKQDYPCLYEIHLDFDGKTFTLTEPDSNDVRIRTFEYLMKYDNTEFYSQSSKTPGRRFDYVLTHDNNVTWEKLFIGLVSSQMGTYIDHYSIYSERVQ